MKILYRAPALAILAALILGLGTYDRSGNFIAFILVTCGVFCALCFSTYTKNFSGQWQIFCVGLIIALLCSWRAYHENSMPEPENISFHSETGTITNVRTWGKIYVAFIDTQHYGKLAMKMQFAEIMSGTRIKFDGVTQPFKHAKARGEFDEGKFFHAQGARSWVKISGVEELPPKFSFSRLRYIISRKLAISLPSLTSAYLRAAWLGERIESLAEKHRAFGTSHLLVVSGFHVGIVIAFAGIFFGGKPVILSAIMWAYVLLTGAAPSALRAALMIQIALLSKILHRPVNGVNSVCMAGILLLVWRPFLFWDIGFRLSMLCALVITAMNKKFWWLISTAAWLVSFPQVSATFGRVPLAGLIVNFFAPLYFSGAFFVASFSAFLKLIKFPASFLLKISDGIFALFEISAGAFANFLPVIIGWNFFIAWLGAGFLIFCVCKSLELSFLQSLFITCGGSFAAVMIFA